MELITNRTFRDVERWKSLRDKGWAGMSESERKEWLGEITPTPSATRGMYTHNDLNRVGRAVETLLARIRQAGYKVPNLVIKTDWTYQDTISVSDMEQYFYNISVLRESITVYPYTPQAPTVDKKLDYKLANDLEQILVDVDECSRSLLQAWYYSGDLMLGEV